MLDPFSPEKKEDVVPGSKACWRISTRTFITYVKARRGAKLDDGQDLFTGEIWLARRAQELGLIDGIAHLKPRCRKRFGDKVKFRRYGLRKPILVAVRGLSWRKTPLPGLRSAPPTRVLVCDVIIKIVTLFLIAMGGLAMFGKLRFPGQKAVAIRKMSALRAVQDRQRPLRLRKRRPYMTAWLLSGLGLLILLLAGDALVRGAVNLSLRMGVPALIVSLTIVAFGTSAPELLIAISAIKENAPGIALGNVVGSNTANILLVLGVAGLAVDACTPANATAAGTMSSCCWPRFCSSVWPFAACSPWSAGPSC